ncbi:TRAP-type mannitol/chloroaromatic compound transport system, small permease component [Tranquillimonas rosea]|uniref:TRAP transporter small permease protein n=1 Tax=Tranquillimonas rosea TaxID=641238 RepID=A0A1H9WJI5_9RHOB|nr:TRAP transporter small permease subunit [Tranquillimonas rosea]SES34040.1 TRAP-type mannitol/chloroaromatic compound transport system, small permease component [Tranquillimonas rosea]
MIDRYLRFCRMLDIAARGLCSVAALALAATVLLIVVLRYGFGVGYIELQDAASYAFAALAIFSIPVCLAHQGHVRVEVISEKLGERYRRGSDIVALVLFLIPVFGLLIWAYWPDLAYSWSIREASVETGGLGGLFLLKTALPLAAALTILQGIAAVLARRPL